MDDGAITSIGASVRARRRELGLTQTDLADLAGVSERWLRSLERGRSVRTDELVRTLDALGLALRIHRLEELP